MDINVLRGLITLGLLIAFLAICVYAWSSRNRQRFDETARQILDDTDESPTLKAGQSSSTRADSAQSGSASHLHHQPNAG